MKLRNLMYATMIACAFASCSKDDVPEQGAGNNGDANATLSLKIAAPIATKAATDADIKGLCVYVFNGTGTGAAFEAKSSTMTGTDQVLNIPVSAGDKSIVVVANDVDRTVANLGALYALTKDYDESLGNFTMNSKTYEVTIAPNVVNYLGYGSTGEAEGHYLTAAGTGAVNLYRNVAKISLSSLQVNTTTSESSYSNAQLAVSSIFVLHGSKATKLVGGAAAWASTESAGDWLNGATNDEYAAWVTTIKNWIDAATDDQTRTPKHNYLEEKYAPYSATDNHIFTYTETLADKVAAKTNITDFYTYENTNTTTRTLLVVAGKFTYGNLSAADVQTRYYSVAIGEGVVFDTSAKPSGAEVERTAGVLRNVQYNVSLTVKGPGYETPFGPDGGGDGGSGNTALDVKVQVVPFGQVSQSEEIE